MLSNPNVNPQSGIDYKKTFTLKYLPCVDQRNLIEVLVNEINELTLENKHKDIFACLFSIHNIISLSCHEQVCLSGRDKLIIYWKISYSKEKLYAMQIVISHVLHGVKSKQMQKWIFILEYEL